MGPRWSFLVVLASGCGFLDDGGTGDVARRIPTRLLPGLDLNDVVALVEREARGSYWVMSAEQ